MKLLILFAAMGVIGVIGTIDESYAQTILTLNPLPNTPDAEEGTFGISIEPPTIPFWHLLSGEETFLVVFNEINLGHIFVPYTDRGLIPNPILTTSNITMICEGSFDSVKGILDPDIPNDVKGLKAPDNITPKGNNTIIATGINWDEPKKVNDENDYPCTSDFEAPSKHPLIMTKELIFTLYNQSNNKAYYFSPRENIMEAQPIPLCTTETINATTLTLKGDTKMCYGKHESNMVIVTKKLTGFYGASESITTPTKQYALDSDRNDTLDYLNLLKKLYLPAI